MLDQTKLLLSHESVFAPCDTEEKIGTHVALQLSALDANYILHDMPLWVEASGSDSTLSDVMTYVPKALSSPFYPATFGLPIETTGPLVLSSIVVVSLTSLEGRVSAVQEQINVRPTIDYTVDLDELVNHCKSVTHTDRVFFLPGEQKRWLYNAERNKIGVVTREYPDEITFVGSLRPELLPEQYWTKFRDATAQDFDTAGVTRPALTEANSDPGIVINDTTRRMLNGNITESILVVYSADGEQRSVCCSELASRSAMQLRRVLNNKPEEEQDVGE